MPDWLLVFLLQAAFVTLLGMQSLNLNQGHVALAGVCSGMIGITQFYVLTTVAAAGVSAVGSPVWWAFVMSGPVGVMISHPLQGHIRRVILKR